MTYARHVPIVFIVFHLLLAPRSAWAADDFDRRGAIREVISADGRAILLVDRKLNIRLFDLKSKKPLGPPIKIPCPISAIAVAPDNRRIAAGCRINDGDVEGAYYEFDGTTGKQLKTKLGIGPVLSLSYV